MSTTSGPLSLKTHLATSTLHICSTRKQLTKLPIYHNPPDNETPGQRSHRLYRLEWMSQMISNVCPKLLSVQVYFCIIFDICFHDSCREKCNSEIWKTASTSRCPSERKDVIIQSRKQPAAFAKINSYLLSRTCLIESPTAPHQFYGIF